MRWFIWEVRNVLFVHNLMQSTARFKLRNWKQLSRRLDWVATEAVNTLVQFVYEGYKTVISPHRLYFLSYPFQFLKFF